MPTRHTVTVKCATKNPGLAPGFLLSILELNLEGIHSHDAHAAQNARLRSAEVDVGLPRRGEEGAVPHAREAHRARAVVGVAGRETQHGRHARFGDTFFRTVAALHRHLDNLFAVL